MPTLSDILKSKIGKGGKSKTYVASQMGVGEKTIENYMNGKREPKQAALVRLAEIVGFSLSELGERSVPRETKRSNSSEKSHISDSQAFYGHDFSALVKAHLLLVESNNRLSIAYERLAAKVDVTARESEETRLAAAANIDALRELARETAVKSGLFRSGKDFLEAYDKRVNEFVRKKKGVGSDAVQGKARKV